MAFCDFCTCEACRTGIEPELTHAPTEAGRWICDVCDVYEECLRQTGQRGYHPSDHDVDFIGPVSWVGPCNEEHCPHRPKLVGPWTTLAQDSAKEHEDGLARIMQGAELVVLYSSGDEVVLTGQEAADAWTSRSPLHMHHETFGHPVSMSVKGCANDTTGCGNEER